MFDVRLVFNLRLSVRVNVAVIVFIVHLCVDSRFKGSASAWL